MGGWNTPIGGSNTPMGGWKTPIGGNNTPIGVRETPIGGGKTPRVGVYSPDRGWCCAMGGG